MQAPLKEVIEKIKSCKSLPVVVFDLDDTLFSTANRNLTIIRNFVTFYGDYYPDFRDAVSKLTLADMNWSVDIALKNAGLDLSGDFYDPFHQYWGDTFFTNEYCTLDLPNPGAVAYVNACHQAGALVYYLTGRHAGYRGMDDGMGQGTTLALNDRKFPFWRGRCELNLKMHKQEKDAEYKSRALEDIKSLRGSVVATFDNEPRNVGVFLDHFPDAMNFWVKTTWDPSDKPPKEGAHTIEDFQ